MIKIQKNRVKNILENLKCPLALKKHQNQDRNKIILNNRDKKRDTKLKGVTDENGEQTFTIGIGNYTFNVTKDNPSDEITGIFSNDFLNYNRTIELK